MYFLVTTVGLGEGAFSATLCLLFLSPFKGEEETFTEHLPRDRVRVSITRRPDQSTLCQSYMIGTPSVRATLLLVVQDSHPLKRPLLIPPTWCSTRIALLERASALIWRKLAASTTFIQILQKPNPFCHTPPKNMKTSKHTHTHTTPPPTCFTCTSRQTCQERRLFCFYCKITAGFRILPKTKILWLI